jgi:hypothetical protein
MGRTTRRLSILTAAALAALTVGVVAASANGGGGGAAVSTSKLVTSAATQLSVSRSALVTAIHNSADAYIASEQTAGDISSARADDLTASSDDNLDLAYRLSQTATVASNLSITTDALNAGFAAARKAIALAQVAAAQTAGDITADQATARTAKINAKTFAGYKNGVGLGKAGKRGGRLRITIDQGGGQNGLRNGHRNLRIVIGNGVRHGRRG